MPDGDAIRRFTIYIIKENGFHNRFFVRGALHFDQAAALFISNIIIYAIFLRISMINNRTVNQAVRFISIQIPEHDELKILSQRFYKGWLIHLRHNMKYNKSIIL